jgi:hypothetical protein
MMSFLNGKKTYLVAVVVFVFGGLKALGLVDQELIDTLMPLLGAAGLAALRKSI